MLLCITTTATVLMGIGQALILAMRTVGAVTMSGDYDRRRAATEAEIPARPSARLDKRDRKSSQHEQQSGEWSARTHARERARCC